MTVTPPVTVTPAPRAERVGATLVAQVVTVFSGLASLVWIVAVALSAQSTDVGVNKATRRLFADVKTPEAMVALGEEGLKAHIKTIGLFNTKAKNVIALSEMLIRDHGGVVPEDREALERLPGVGRKTANVVLNTAFGQPTLAVDTHIFRLGNRLGLAPGKPVIVVLPGSRTSEVSKLMQPFGEALQRLAHHGSDYEVIIPVVPNLRPLIEKRLKAWPMQPHLIEGDEDKFRAFKLAAVALAASGTVTLELALAGTPMVVAYKVDKVIAPVLRRLITAPSAVLPNHWHLLLWPESDGQLGSFMQRLTITHVRRWQQHRGYAGLGHVYQGRYKSFPVQDDTHFTTLLRYVERNPLRANLVKQAEDWRWSSLFLRTRGTVEDQSILTKWPIDTPRDWIKSSN